MIIWTAFLLGLVGSVHCAGMCGPLALAVPGASGGRVPLALSRVGYNLGRVTAYIVIGLLFGLVGQTVAFAGFQRWLSLATGLIVLIALLPVSRRGLQIPPIKGVTVLKSAFGFLLRQRSMRAVYLLGVLNGFLPCGLVYVAAAGALTAGSMLNGAASMLAFGLGTVPTMFAIGFVGKNLQFRLRFRLQKLLPVCLAVVGTLLVLRGLALGIPYLSPNLVAGHLYGCH